MEDFLFDKKTNFSLMDNKKTHLVRMDQNGPEARRVLMIKLLHFLEN